ncbi:hypothetical protein DZD18_04905 [Rhodobacteraceae bacterium W635]|uniref:hypothetical protein n=1 Tax=Nioella halotolerans TaxID=2303578 RepID=UPI000E3E1F88|nr:hypothetical protein DZD18_04905 [Rhodobacteraceae bacterium W635]
MSNHELLIGILTILIGAIVAFLVAQHRITQDRKTRQKEWLRDRIAHLNSARRALQRFESRLTTKRGDVNAYRDKEITLDQIGGLSLRYPDAVFDSDTDKAISEDVKETEIVDQVNELDTLIEELEDLVAQFLKEGENPAAGPIADHLKAMEDTAISSRELITGARDRLKNKMTLLG